VAEVFGGDLAKDATGVAATAQHDDLRIHAKSAISC
jgi:hypothetical protein